MADQRGLFWLRTQLCSCNVGPGNGLVISMEAVEKCILPFCTDYEKEALSGNFTRRGITLRIFDIDEGTETTFTLKFWRTFSFYCLADGWKEFVQRKGLKAGDILTFLWEEIDGQVKFCITRGEW